MALSLSLSESFTLPQLLQQLQLHLAAVRKSGGGSRRRGDQIRIQHFTKKTKKRASDTLQVYFPHRMGCFEAEQQTQCAVSHPCVETSSVAFWNILVVLFLAAGLDWYGLANSNHFFDSRFLSFFLLVTSTFKDPRRFRRFSFPLLTALTCTGLEEACSASTPASRCEVPPSSTFNTAGSSSCWIFVWLLSVSPWLDGSFFSQSLNELVLRAFTPAPPKILGLDGKQNYSSKRAWSEGMRHFK